MHTTHDIIFSWLKDWLSEREQRDDLYVEATNWHRDVQIGPPEAALLGPVLFITHINDIVQSLTWKINQIF